MQYTVVHSKDPYLLARLATDITLNTGINCRSSVDSIYNLFADGFEWIEIGSNSFNFHSHKCIGEPIRHELTSRNYIKVLTQILQP